MSKRDKSRARISRPQHGDDYVEAVEGFINPKTLIAPAVAVYSHIAKVNRGRIVYISGQVSSDASGKIIGEGDFEAQVEQVFANLKIAVEALDGRYRQAELLPRRRGRSGRRAENAPDTRPLSQCCQAASQYVCCRQPPDAARVADRDRGGCGHRRLSQPLVEEDLSKRLEGTEALYPNRAT